MRRLLHTPNGRAALLSLLLLLLLGAPAEAQRRRRRAAARPRPPAQLTVQVLDIGQGDGAVIVSPTGKVVVSDVGNPGNQERVLAAVRRFTGRECRIDLFVASHPHADHIGSAAEVIRACRVARVLDSKFPSTTQTAERYLRAVEASGAQFVAAEPGQTFDMGGGAIISVLGPVKPFFAASDLRPGGSDANANSVVFRLDHGNFSMLFTGDAEAETEARLIKERANLRAKVLKVGHHGSRHATSEEFLRAVRPERATISVGSDNRFGHPTPETLRELREARVTFYRTDLQGQITITSDGRGYRVATERQASQAALNRGRRPR